MTLYLDKLRSSAIFSDSFHYHSIIVVQHTISSHSLKNMYKISRSQLQENSFIFIFFIFCLSWLKKMVLKSKI